MFARVARLGVAVALLATLPLTAAVRPARAAGCAQIRGASALALTASGALLAGTESGALYRLGAGCWSALTSLPGAVPIDTLVAVPGHNPTLLASGGWLTLSGQSRRLYRSEDGGVHWTAALTGLPRTTIQPAQIVLTPDGTLVMAYDCPADWISPVQPLRCPQGLARSVDGGRSWRSVGPRMGSSRGVVVLGDGSLLAAAVSPVSPTRQGGSFYGSRDGGRTWRRVGGADPSDLLGMARLYAVPWEPQGVIRLGDMRLGKAHLFRSTDGGAHWASYWEGTSLQLHARSVGLVAVTGLPRTHTLLLGASFSFYVATSEGIYRSDDGGASWTHPRIGVAASTKVLALLTGADGATAYAAATTGVYRSTDDGRTWQRIGGNAA